MAYYSLEELLEQCGIIESGIIKNFTVTDANTKLSFCFVRAYGDVYKTKIPGRPGPKRSAKVLERLRVFIKEYGVPLIDQEADPDHEFSCYTLRMGGDRFQFMGSDDDPDVLIKESTKDEYADCTHLLLLHRDGMSKHIFARNHM